MNKTDPLRNPALRAVALVGALLLPFLLSINAPLSDFKLYYYGGLVERSGTYTDTARVLGTAAAHGATDMPTTGVYGAPSLVALVFDPLSHLSIGAAETVWALALLALSAVVVRRAVGNYRWPFILAIVLLAYPGLAEITSGNASFLTFVLLAAAWSYSDEPSGRKAGLALGLAIAFKWFPIFFLIPFVLTRRWNVAKCALGTFAVLFAISVPILGWHDTGAALRATFHVAGRVDPSRNNAGLPGRLLLLTGSQTLAKTISTLLLTASVVTLVLLRKRASTKDLFSLAIGLLFLSQGLTWSIYLTAAMFMMITVWRATNDNKLRLAAAISFALTEGVLFAVFHDGFHYSWLVSTETIGLVLLTSVLGFVLGNKPKALAPADA